MIPQRKSLSPRPRMLQTLTPTPKTEYLQPHVPSTLTSALVEAGHHRKKHEEGFGCRVPGHITRTCPAPAPRNQPGTQTQNCFYPQTLCIKSWMPEPCPWTICGLCSLAESGPLSLQSAQGSCQTPHTHPNTALPLGPGAVWMMPFSLCNAPTTATSSQRGACPAALVWRTKTIQGDITIPAKVVAVREVEVCSSLGQTSFYRRFIKDLAPIPGPLHPLTPKAGSERPREDRFHQHR